MSFEDEVTADSPLLWWDMRAESAGTVPDQSGNALDGFTVGGPTLDADGLTFDGSGQWVFSSDTFPTSWPEFCFEVVIRPEASLNFQGIMSIYDDTNPGAIAIYSQAAAGDPVYTAEFYDGVAAHITPPGAPVVPAVLQSVILDYDGADLTIYVDGSVYATVAATGSAEFASPFGLVVADDVFTGDGFIGLVRHAIMYDHAIGPTRAAAHAAQINAGDQNVDADLLTSSPTFFAAGVALQGDLHPPRLNAAPTFFSPAVGQRTAATGAAVPTFYIQRRDINSANGLDLPSAQPEEIVWTLNEPTEATFDFPKHAYSQTQIPTLASAAMIYEYLIFYDDALQFRGPMIEPAAAGSQGAVVCHCADILWVMNRLNIDAPRHNFLTNPSFESNFSGWTKTGSFTDTAATNQKMLGSKSAKFVNATAGADSYYGQSFTAGPNGVGLLLTVTGYYFIESITQEALQSRGLYLEAGPHHTAAQINFWTIDEAEEVGKWIRAEFTVTIPPGEQWDCNLRVYAPQATIYWDALAVTAMDSTGAAEITGSASAPADIAQIAGVLVRHVQTDDYGKVELHCGKNTPLNGVTLFRQYQFADHTNFADAISEFTDRDDGFDIAVEVTPTTKSFHTYTPQKGTDRSGSVTLKFVQGASDNNCADYRYSRSGSACITRETFTGQGDGPDREEGEYADTSQVGGLVLQEVRTAPQDTALDSLLPLAREVVKKRRKPPVLVEFDIKASAGLINVLEVGDTVNTNLADGYASMTGARRIVKLRLNCRNRVLTAYVNEA